MVWQTGSTVVLATCTEQYRCPQVVISTGLVLQPQRVTWCADMCVTWVTSCHCAGCYGSCTPEEDGQEGHDASSHQCLLILDLSHATTALLLCCRLMPSQQALPSLVQPAVCEQSCQCAGKGYSHQGVVSEDYYVHAACTTALC